MNFLKKNYRYLISIVLGLAAYFFWAVPYKSMLSYHEQLQLFQTDAEYFCNKMSQPGGLADYVSEFLVQFYFYPQVGAAVIAVLLVAVQLLSWLLIKRHADHAVGFALSFLPALMLWMQMGDPNILLSLTVATVFALLAALACPYILLIPVVYYLFGTAVYAFALYVAVSCILKRKYLFAGAVVFVTLVSLLVSGRIVCVEWIRIFVGLNYFRYPLSVPVMMLTPALVAVLLPFVMAYVGKMKFVANNDNAKLMLPALLATCLAVLPFWNVYYDKEVTDAIDYDFLVRTGNWEKVVNKADKETPQSPMSVVCLNLALQRTGQLPYRMFDFFQNGSEGLIQPLNKDPFTPVPTAEALLCMGMVNLAQEYFFEAQEAIPNYNKSARLTRRLAETNLVNGQYKVAKRYLTLLKKTLFYRSWAEETEALLYNEKKINEHPLYGKLRKQNYAEDFLISTDEMEKMIGRLLMKDKTNQMAYEYLMAYSLLNRDLTHFYDYFQLGKDMGYPTPPVIYEQTHAFLQAQRTNNQNIANQFMNTPTWRYLLGK